MIDQQYSWITALVLVIDLVIRGGLSIRVIMRRRPVGVTMAWLSVVLVFQIALADSTWEESVS